MTQTPVPHVEPDKMRVGVGEARVLRTQVEPGVLDQLGLQQRAARTARGRRHPSRWRHHAEPQRRYGIGPHAVHPLPEAPPTAESLVDNGTRGQDAAVGGLGTHQWALTTAATYGLLKDPVGR
jgi:hypothetical protein